MPKNTSSFSLLSWQTKIISGIPATDFILLASPARIHSLKDFRRDLGNIIISNQFFCIIYINITAVITSIFSYSSCGFSSFKIASSANATFYILKSLPPFCILLLHSNN
jgi:hypothetical protein